LTPHTKLLTDPLIFFAETALLLLAHHTVCTLSALDPASNFLARGGLAPVVLRRICEHMAAHLHDNITLSELAVLAGVTPNHFAIAFKQSTGVAPHAWLRLRRIKRAKTLLRSGEHDVAKVALLVAYANQSSFGAAFRREMGLAPTRWRRLT
jgi:AraC family transcriptional regulator